MAAYNFTHYNGTDAYTDPKATVHIVAGAAGCREHLDPAGGPSASWSATRVDKYGYGKLKATRSALHWEQFDDATGTVVDAVTIRKSAPRFAAVATSRDSRFAEQQRIYQATMQCTDRLGRMTEAGCAVAEPGRFTV